MCVCVCLCAYKKNVFVNAIQRRSRVSVYCWLLLLWNGSGVQVFFGMCCGLLDVLLLLLFCACVVVVLLVWLIVGCACVVVVLLLLSM